jgi:diacylglycerol O-acyltransferase/trehalose O-mycolyltransferase
MAFTGGKSSGWVKRFAIAALATAVLPGLVNIAGGSATAGAFSSPGLPIEYLDVPSQGMGRDIKVEFMSGGPNPRAVYVLDSMEAGDDFNGWDVSPTRSTGTTGPGRRCDPSVASRFHSDWYGPAAAAAEPTPTWETFLTRELPAWLAANRTPRPAPSWAVDGRVVCAGAGRLPPATVHLRRIVVGL